MSSAISAEAARRPFASPSGARDEVLLPLSRSGASSALVYWPTMSGMAGKVRRATESEEFDLANYDQARCDELAKGAFSEAFPLANMVRLSFVVGGGKLVRQKYTDDLPKIFMGSLTAIGYQEDSAAAVELGSGGKFKYQHDTGKNLKFVHVFPHCTGPSAGAAGEEGAGEDEEEEAAQTPEEILMRCDADDFKELVADQLPTYGQKKRLLELLKARVGCARGGGRETVGWRASRAFRRGWVCLGDSSLQGVDHGGRPSSVHISPEIGSSRLRV